MPYNADDLKAMSRRQLQALCASEKKKTGLNIRCNASNATLIENLSKISEPPIKKQEKPEMKKQASSKNTKSSRAKKTQQTRAKKPSSQSVPTQKVSKSTPCHNKDIAATKECLMTQQVRYDDAFDEVWYSTIRDTAFKVFAFEYRNNKVALIFEPNGSVKIYNIISEKLETFDETRDVALAAAARKACADEKTPKESVEVYLHMELLGKLGQVVLTNWLNGSKKSAKVTKPIPRAPVNLVRKVSEVLRNMNITDVAFTYQTHLYDELDFYKIYSIAYPQTQGLI